MEAATGERIVAFGRAGKSPENPFFSAILQARSTAGAMSRRPVYSATFFKAESSRVVVRGTADMALLSTHEQKARQAQIIESTRVDHARRRLCRAPMRGEGHLHDGCEAHDRRSQTLPAKLRLAFSRDARTGRPCEVVGAAESRSESSSFARTPLVAERGGTVKGGMQKSLLLIVLPWCCLRRRRVRRANPCSEV